MDAPWSNKETLSTKDRVARLSKEILDFEKYIEPTKEEQLNRDTVLYSVSQLVESLWPNNNTITAFGSSVTGLAFPASDVDININFQELPQDKIDILKVLRRATTKEGIFQRRRMILAANAKVPVLMATDENEVSMDITIQNECFSSDRTVAWIKEYPPLKPLFMVLKQAIGNSRVSKYPGFEPLSAKTAGLASYSLICLIVHYLQMGVPEDVKPTNPDYYGALLIGYLKYCSKFENNQKAISFEDGGRCYTKSDCPIPFETKTGRITIIDPDVPGANVGRSTSKFDVIQLIFEYTFEQLLNRMTSSSKTESILSSIVKVEHHYFGDPRRQGIRFKVQQTWIENGAPEQKKGFDRNRFGGKRRSAMPYEEPIRSRNRFDDDDIYTQMDNSSGGYKGGYKQSESKSTYKGGYKQTESKSTYKGGYKRSNEIDYEDSGRYNNDGFQNSYRQHNSYRAEPYSKRFSQQQDNYTKEYQRHKKNNNHHLAEHYKFKSEKSSRR